MVFGRKKQQAVEDTVGPGAERTRLTPVDVQQKVFRLAFRGYNERDVDQFLDTVTEDLAALHEENKRLREELEFQGPGEGAADARRHAEEIIRRAREEAARISAGTTPVAGALPSASYLVRERDFLHQLAGLVQGHAEMLKSEARRAKAQAEPTDEEPAEAEDDEPAQVEEDPNEEDRFEAATAPEEAGAADPPAPALEDTAAMPPPVEPGELAEWSNPFVTEEGGEGPEEARESDEQEPSLRELFWGEE